MKHLELILDDPGISKTRRSDTDNIILRKAKIKMLAYKGKFDGFKQWEIKEAKEGLCPRGIEVHHIIPLNCKNTRIDLDNMVVIDKKSHNWLHNNIYTPSLSKCQVGQSCFIWLPDMNTGEIITWSDIFPFVVIFEKEKQRLMKSILF